MFERNPYLYFVDSTRWWCYPAKNLVSMGPGLDSELDLMFTPMFVMNQNGPYEENVNDVLTLQLTTDNTHKDAMQYIIDTVNGSKDPFIVLNTADSAGSSGHHLFTGLTSHSYNAADVDSIQFAGTSSTTTLWYSFGTGFTSTGEAPDYEIRRYGPEKETTILLDLQGLSSADNVVTDAIGLAAGNPAFIGRYTTGYAGDGYNAVITRVEFTCLEAPTVSAGANVLDFDLVKATAGTYVFDTDDLTAQAGYGVIAEMGGNISLNQTIVVNTPGQATNDDYFYLKSGAAVDGSGTDGLFTAGKLQIKIYSRDAY